MDLYCAAGYRPVSQLDYTQKQLDKIHCNWQFFNLDDQLCILVEN